MSPIFNRRFKRLLLFAIVASLAVIATSAIALSANSPSPGVDPLQGISAAANAPVGVTSASARAMLTSLAGQSGPLASQLLDQARLLPAAVSGQDLYLIPSTSGDLCVFLDATSEACTSPLTDSDPAFFSVVDVNAPGGSGPLVFGVARDDVTEVSFSVAGQAETVPVQNNVFSYQATSAVDAGAITDPTATFTDGEVVSLG
jgi:hypothetical protein